MMILDIHTHRSAPQPDAVVACSPAGFDPLPDQLYSLGIHPWDLKADVDPQTWTELENNLRRPEVVAVGEAGVDIPKGGLLFRQMLVFKRQILLSEELAKPLVIHDVKAHEIIIGMKKDINPSQNWVIHGFRYKPSVAKMFIDAGCWLSFGPLFNPETLLSVPEDRLLAETDDTPVDIREVIRRLSETKGKDLTELIAENSSRFLNLN